MLAWDAQETFPTALWSLKATRPGAQESCSSVVFLECSSLPRSREWGSGAPTFSGERTTGPGTGESPHFPVVPVWRQLSWIDLSWFLMKAAGACQPSLATEGGLWERSLSVLEMERLESVAATVSVAWWRPDLELRVTRLVYLLQGFPGVSVPTGRYSCSFLICLPWSLGANLWPVPSAEHPGSAYGFPAQKPKPPLGTVELWGGGVRGARWEAVAVFQVRDRVVTRGGMCTHCPSRLSTSVLT